ncbi:MAG: hypothetical protein DRP01_06965 [Archaeoglobales archaeon]|nr:MAG: hypothetical protein DRP01_06965 [Archaeoglobales archaeon]
MVSKKHSVIDQREIQKIGGKASRYPTSYIVVSLLEKHGLFNSVLDVTYGQGRFYYYRRPRFLVGVDPRVWDWVVKPDIFIPKPVWAVKEVIKKLNIVFDVIVCDPPAWNPGTHYNKRDLYSFVVGSSKIIIQKTIELAKELDINYMLLHYKDVINGPKVVEDIEFIYVSRYLNNPDMRRTHFTLYSLGDENEKN